MNRQIIIFGTIFRHVPLLVTEILRQYQNFLNTPPIIHFAGLLVEIPCVLFSFAIILSRAGCFTFVVYFVVRVFFGHNAVGWSTV